MSRPHHYMFAHRVLPSAAFGDPDGFYQTLRSDGLQFLGFLWETAGAEAGGEILDASGLRFEIREGESRTIVIIALPAAQEPPEAHAVAVVLGSDPRFLTLEQSVDYETQQPTNMLCGWDRQGNHSNYGEGPEVDGFYDAVVRHLSRRWWQFWR